MIVKELQKPTILLQYEAALRRIDKNHAKYNKIEKEFAKRQAGFKGEQSLAYHLAFLPDKEYKILQDIRLKNDLYHFQIDTLIITPKYLLILEIKNISGTIHYDHTFKQFTRSFNNHEKGIANPMIQVERQMFQLTSWLKRHHIEPLPIEYLILFSQSSTILRTSSFNKDIVNRIGHIERLSTLINGIDRGYDLQVITNKLANKITRLIKKYHNPLSHDFLSVYDIQKSQVVSGAQCPVCHALPMSRVGGKWYCPRCQSDSLHAGQAAIIDYFLLIKSTITNKECRDFLHLSSSRISHQILQSMNLPSTGQTKGRVYHPPLDLY